MGDEVHLFADLSTIIFSLLNLTILLLVIGGVAFGIFSYVRLNRRVARLEERIKQKNE